MYQKILKEAIHELKEEEFKEQYTSEESKVPTREFVSDCVIETDMEILIPSDYVNEIEERISLYKSLDDLENENDLLEFEMNLTDRFGPHPLQVLELFSSIRLRWIGKSLGFHKILLKSDKMIGSFVADQESPYYQSKVFTQILQFIQSNPPGVKMYERNNGLRLSAEKISSVGAAIGFLDGVIKS